MIFDEEFAVEFLEKLSPISLILGGSRSNNTHKINSDYDYFAIFDSYDIYMLIDDVVSKVEKFENVKLAVYYIYLKNFGYLIKVYGYDYNIDLFINTTHRISEFAFMSNNIILFDKDDFIKKRYNENTISTEFYLAPTQFEVNHIRNIKLISVCEEKMDKSLQGNDFWLSFKYLSQYLSLLIELIRYNMLIYSNTIYKVEKEFSKLDYTYNGRDLSSYMSINEGIQSINDSYESLKKIVKYEINKHL